MKKLLTLGLTLAVTATASAQLVRLEVDFIDNKGLVPGDTYRVYAVMENEGDILDAVYGEASAPMRVSASKGFYQHPKGGALSADIQRYDTMSDESLLYDSWVTIGAEDNYMNAVSGFIMEDALADFEDFGLALLLRQQGVDESMVNDRVKSLASDKELTNKQLMDECQISTNDGAWFVTPDKRQAAAGPSKRILLMQLTTHGEVNGLINLHGRTKAVTDSDGNAVGGQEVIQSEGLTFVCSRPR
jgi:hypothetical protein